MGFTTSGFVERVVGLNRFVPSAPRPVILETLQPWQIRRVRSAAVLGFRVAERDGNLGIVLTFEAEALTGRDAVVAELVVGAFQFAWASGVVVRQKHLEDMKGGRQPIIFSLVGSGSRIAAAR